MGLRQTSARALSHRNALSSASAVGQTAAKTWSKHFGLIFALRKPLKHVATSTCPEDVHQTPTPHHSYTCRCTFRRMYVFHVSAGVTEEGGHRGVHAVSVALMPHIFSRGACRSFHGEKTSLSLVDREVDMSCTLSDGLIVVHRKLQTCFFLQQENRIHCTLSRQTN